MYGIDRVCCSRLCLVAWHRLQWRAALRLNEADHLNLPRLTLHCVVVPLKDRRDRTIEAVGEVAGAGPDWGIRGEKESGRGRFELCSSFLPLHCSANVDWRVGRRAGRRAETGRERERKEGRKEERKKERKKEGKKERVK
jgi:hypothetical protein